MQVLRCRSILQPCRSVTTQSGSCSTWVESDSPPPGLLSPLRGLDPCWLASGPRAAMESPCPRTLRGHTCSTGTRSTSGHC
ncbi:hypothetical protein V5799_032169 [Amblyomma americanum]|uniref:Uncharacterized protein n=1 Tax=Amblyomma americanum TaxID=6943 RepID=A0AAQ4DRY1_AMBAM